MIDLERKGVEKNKMTGTLNAYYLNESSSPESDIEDEEMDESENKPKVLKEEVTKSSEKEKVANKEEEKEKKSEKEGEKKKSEREGEEKENVARSWWEINQEKEFE